MLTKWLPKTENSLPANASHQVGVGAFVLNENNEVLVVQELRGPLRGTGIWKMPTGLCNPGEDIGEAAEREVLEETGIKATFKSVLAIRQAHGFAFGKSDMFFVCALKPEAGQKELMRCENEIAGVRWMPMAEYADYEFFRSRPTFKVITDRCLQYASGTYKGFSAEKLQSYPGRSRMDYVMAGSDPMLAESLQGNEASEQLQPRL